MIVRELHLHTGGNRKERGNLSLTVSTKEIKKLLYSAWVYVVTLWSRWIGRRIIPTLSHQSRLMHKPQNYYKNKSLILYVQMIWNIMLILSWPIDVGKGKSMSSTPCRHCPWWRPFMDSLEGSVFFIPKAEQAISMSTRTKVSIFSCRLYMSGCCQNFSFNFVNLNLQQAFISWMSLSWL